MFPCMLMDIQKLSFLSFLSVSNFSYSWALAFLTPTLLVQVTSLYSCWVVCACLCLSWSFFWWLSSVRESLLIFCICREWPVVFWGGHFWRTTSCTEFLPSIDQFSMDFLPNRSLNCILAPGSPCSDLSIVLFNFLRILKAKISWLIMLTKLKLSLPTICQICLQVTSCREHLSVLYLHYNLYLGWKLGVFFLSLIAC